MKVTSPVMALLVCVSMILSLTATAIAAGGLPFGTSISANPTSSAGSKAVAILDSSALSKEVREFISKNYLSHAGEFPDPDESLEALQLYVANKGKAGSTNVFQEAIARFPESRHMHFGLADALWSDYQQSKQQRLAGLVFEEVMKAARIGLNHGGVLYLWLVSDAAIASGKIDAARAFFDEVLGLYPGSYYAHLEYAKFLRRLPDQNGAEQHFKTAISLRPAGNFDANVLYAELLLDAGKFEAALSAATLPGERSFYADFLRGVALERLGNIEDASRMYNRYRDFSKQFPAPDKYRSTTADQAGVTFQGTSVQTASLVSIDNLSWVVACEAGTESTGGMRAVGWTARQRALRGNDGCVNTGRGSGTVDDWYNQVICYPGVYAGVHCDSSTHVDRCTNSGSRSPTSDEVANDVYYGMAPEPTYNWCPGDPNYTGMNACSDYCGVGNVTAYNNITPHSFYAGSCTYWNDCRQSVGTICGNGGVDNCFYHTRQ